MNTDQISQVVALRIQGKSYSFISREIGVHRNKIGLYCKQHGLETEHSRTCYSDARRSVNQKRREAGDKANTFTCKGCGKEYVRQRRCGEEGKQYCSRECAFADVKEWYAGPGLNDGPGPSCQVDFVECGWCGKLFAARHGAVTCSEECRKKRAAVKTCEHAKAKHEAKGVIYTCKWCGESFQPKYGDKNREYCSEECSTRQARRNQQTHRRIHSKDQYIEDVSLVVLFRRDGGICQLCGESLSLDVKLPKKLAPTVDHVIPLSKGGEHAYHNVQLLCFECNRLKSDNIFNDNRGMGPKIAPAVNP